MEGKPITMVMKSLRVKIGNIVYFYVCTHCEWNFFLNKYYPKAKLIMEIEHLK